MTRSSRLSCVAALSLLVASAPVLADGPAPQKQSCACSKNGTFSKVKNYLLEKDDVGVTRLQRWVLTAGGVVALGVTTGGTAAVAATVVAAPGCFSSASQCVATLRNPRANSPVFSSGTSPMPSAVPAPR